MRPGIGLASPGAARLAAATLAMVLGVVGAAQGAGRAVVDALSVAIQADRDGSVMVHETIAVPVLTAERGLLRVVGLRARLPGTEWPLRIDAVHALDEDHQPLPAQIRRLGNEVHVAVSVPRAAAPVTTVRLVYRVRGAVRPVAEGDRLLWNVTDPGRAVPAAVDAVVELRGGPAPSVVRAWSGPIAVPPGPDYRADRTSTAVRVRTLRALHPGETLTLDVVWPPGTFAHSPAWRQALAMGWPFALPAVTLLGTLLAWRARGRDPRHGRSIKPEYVPPRGLLPAEAGALVDQHVEPREAIATLVDLAVRGRLSIEPVAGATDDFVVRRLAPLADDPALAPLERAILQRIFGEDLSLRERSLGELRRDARYVFEPIRRAIETSMVQAGLLSAAPAWARQRWIIAGLTVLLVTGVLLVRAGRGDDADWALPLGMGLSGAVLLAAAPFMPQRTARGARLLVRVRGFQEFLERAERDRLQRLPADTLHRWLPWAIALGVSDRWIGQFTGLDVEVPEWFGRDEGPFSLEAFAVDLVRFDDLAVAALRSVGSVAADLADAPSPD